MRNFVYTITGNKGCGKSYLASKIVQFYEKNRIKKHIVIVDNSRGYKCDKGLDFLRCFGVDRGTANKNINYKNMILSEKNVMFEFRDLLAKERQKALNKIINAVYEIEDCLLVTDEAHIFFPKTGFAEEYERIITGGRNAQIDQVYIVQRIQLVNLLCLSLSDVLIAFREQEINSQRRLAEYFPNVDPAQFGRLKEREFFVKDVCGQVEKLKTDSPL